MASDSIRDGSANGPLRNAEKLDVRTKTAHSALRKPEKRPDDELLWLELGSAIERARVLRGWTLDQLARHCPPRGRDPRQIAKWIAGAERPQLDVLFAIRDFRQPLIIALAELAGIQAETVFRIPRRA